MLFSVSWVKGRRWWMDVPGSNPVSCPRKEEISALDSRTPSISSFIAASLALIFCASCAAGVANANAAKIKVRRSWNLNCILAVGVQCLDSIDYALTCVGGCGCREEADVRSG